MSLLAYFNPCIVIRILQKNRNLLWQLLKRNITSRYKGSVLGLFWSVAQPLMMLAVYSFVFGIVFKARWGDTPAGVSDVPFPLIMFCGMAVFNIFSESVNAGAVVVSGNATYAKKVVFPLEILPIMTVLTSMVFGLAWFAMLLIGCIAFLHEIYWTLIFLPLVFIPLFLLSSGLTFFAASLGVYLRDIQQIIGIITQILFFMTPIFYSVAIVPAKLRWVMEINPLSYLVEECRKYILFEQTPDWTVVAVSFLISFVVFQLGAVWFIKTKKGFADVL